jgi:hypothetical protein
MRTAGKTLQVVSPFLTAIPVAGPALAAVAGGVGSGLEEAGEQQAEGVETNWQDIAAKSAIGAGTSFIPGVGGMVKGVAESAYDATLDSSADERAEIEKILADPTHPRHEEFKAGELQRQEDNRLVSLADPILNIGSNIAGKMMNQESEESPTNQITDSVIDFENMEEFNQYDIPEVEMAKYGGRIYKSGGKSTVNKAGNYTQPGMRKNLFNRIKAGSKGGPAGKWSARKAQMLAKQYKAKGGGYREMGGPIETNEMKAGGLAASQKSLKKWTSQEWDNVTGKKGDRYLPKNVISSMSPQEKAAENRKKKEAGSGNASYSEELASKVRNAENGGPLDLPNNENMTAFMNMNTPMVDPSMQPNNSNVDPSITGFNYNVLSPSSTAPMIRPSYDIDRLPVQPTGFLPTDNLRMINIPTSDVDVNLEKDTTYGSDMPDTFPDLEIKETPLQAALKFAAPAYNIGMGLFSKPEDYSPDYVPVEFTKLDSSQALKNAKEHVAGIRSALRKVSRNPQNLQNLALTGARIASDIQQKYDQVNATIENKAEQLNKQELRNLNRIKKNLEMQQDKVKTDFIQQGIKQLGDISKAEQANQMAVLYSKLGSPDMAKNFSYTPFGQNLFKALNKKNKEKE